MHLPGDEQSAGPVWAGLLERLRREGENGVRYARQRDDGSLTFGDNGRTGEVRGVACR